MKTRRKRFLDTVIVRGQVAVMPLNGNREDRSDSISVFNGPPPTIRVLPREEDEAEFVGAWLAQQSKAGVLPHEFGVFVRSAGQLARAQAAVQKAGLTKFRDDHDVS